MAFRGAEIIIEYVTSQILEGDQRENNSFFFSFDLTTYSWLAVHHSFLKKNVIVATAVYKKQTAELALSQEKGYSENKFAQNDSIIEFIIKRGHIEPILLYIRK